MKFGAIEVDPGWIPEETSSALPIPRLHEHQAGRVGLNITENLDPDYLNVGLMKPLRGFTLMTSEKNRGLQEKACILARIEAGLSLHRLYFNEVGSSRHTDGDSGDDNNPLSF